MENTIRISASAVSRVGRFCADNEDNFYINGRFMYRHETDNIQVSVENTGSEYLFAVSDGMDKELPEKSTPLSAMKELKKVQEKISSSDKDIGIKTEQLCDCIEEANNLIHSAGFASADESKKAAFAGLFISGGMACVFNTGNSRVYLLRKGNARLLTTDTKKTERLLKMGILTSEQAQEISSRAQPDTGGRKAVKRLEAFAVEEGDLFLLCTNGLCDEIDEDRIIQLASSGDDTGHAANLLVSEAVENGGEDNMTALVVRIEEAGEAAGSRSLARKQSGAREGFAAGKRPAAARTVEDDGDDEEDGPTSKFRPRTYIKPTRQSLRRQRMIQQVASTAAAVVIIAAAVFGAYRLWIFLSSVEKEEETLAKTPTTAVTDTLAEDTEIAEASGASAPDKSAAAKTAATVGETTPASASSASTPATQQQYKLPMKYTVQKGDSLYQLSRRFYNNDFTKYKLIMEANDIKDQNSIKVGQVLVIPAP